MAKLEDIQGSIESLKSSCDALAGQLSKIEQRLTRVEDKIDGLNLRPGGPWQDALGPIKNELKNVRDEFAKLKIKPLEDEIRNIKVELEAWVKIGMNPPTDLGGVKKQLDGIEQKINFYLSGQNIRNPTNVSGSSPKPKPEGKKYQMRTALIGVSLASDVIAAGILAKDTILSPTQSIYSGLLFLILLLFLGLVIWAAFYLEME